MPVTGRLFRRLAALLIFAAAPAAAQSTSGSVTVNGPRGNPITDGTPAFTITTSGFQPQELPLQITLQIATRADFGGALLADTTVTGSSVAIVVPRLLPQNISIWWRARVRTALGALLLSDPTGPRTTSPWLTLIFPNERNGTTVGSTQPTFLWSSVAVHPPVAPWTYQILITNNIRPLTGTLSDTTYTPAQPLESNTSYHWSVTATLPTTGDSTHVNSFASFVILDPNAPVATVLYHNFPNPFPTASVSKTCIWFDLRRQSEVQLDILDLRGNHVARIVPRGGLSGLLPAGPYGRASVGSSTGCDDRLTWDGRADNGQYAPPGVYIVRFVGDGKRSQLNLLWKGH
jgi:hypothetical protein